MPDQHLSNLYPKGSILRQIWEDIEQIRQHPDFIENYEPSGSDLALDIAKVMHQNHKELWQETRSRIVGSFPITCNGSQGASDLIRLGNYDVVNPQVIGRRFPIKRHAVVKRTVVLVEFISAGIRSLADVLAEFEFHGLERPTYEHALEFGIQHPKEQQKHPIVFLHAPILEDMTSRWCVLKLGGSYEFRRLDLEGLATRYTGVFAGIKRN